MICGCDFARGKGDLKARRDHQLRREWKGCGVKVKTTLRSVAMAKTARARR